VGAHGKNFTSRKSRRRSEGGAAYSKEKFLIRSAEREGPSSIVPRRQTTSGRKAASVSSFRKRGEECESIQGRGEGIAYKREADTCQKEKCFPYYAKKKKKNKREEEHDERWRKQVSFKWGTKHKGRRIPVTSTRKRG